MADAPRFDPASLAADNLATLLDRLRRGDESALETLMDQYWSRLLHYAASIGLEPDAAEDIVQETFMRI